MLYENPRQIRDPELFHAAASGKANSNGNTLTDKEVGDSSNKTAADSGNDTATLALDDGSSVTSGDSMRVWTGEDNHSGSRYYKSVAIPSPGNPTRYHHGLPKSPTVQGSSSKQTYRQPVIDDQKRQMPTTGVALSGDGKEAGAPVRPGRYRPWVNEDPTLFSGVFVRVPVQIQPMAGIITDDSSEDETGSNDAVVFTPTSSKDARQTLTDSQPFAPRASIIPPPQLALLSAAARSFALACDRIEWTSQALTSDTLSLNEDLHILKRDYEYLSNLLRSFRHDYHHLFDHPYEDFYTTTYPQRTNQLVDNDFHQEMFDTRGYVIGREADRYC